MDNNKSIDNSRNTASFVKVSESITASFQKMKFISILCIAGMILVSLGCVVYSNIKYSEMANKIYVLDHGQVLTASRQDVSINRRDEIIEQSKRLHRLLFTVSPNSSIVKSNLELALEISDKSVYNFYNDRQEKGFYKRIYQTNASQDVIIDSVKTSLSNYPYPVVTYMTVFLQRESNITKYSVVSRCNMVETPRNPKNLNGLQVEKFEVIKNEEVERRKR